jgi:RNA polymerase sigma-70 factor (ECF subfamily)
VRALADHRAEQGEDVPATPSAPPTSVDDVLAAPTSGYASEYADGDRPGDGHPDEGHPDEGYPDGGYPGEAYSDEAYPDEAYPDEAYPDEGYPDAAHAVGDGAVAPAPLRPEELRADFGAHFEAHYQRLVAQLYAITLNPAEAHDVVREAYSRAWRRWARIGASAEAEAWVRRVAVRSTMRSWRRVAARIVPGRRRALADGGEPRTRAALMGLRRLRDTERRAVVLVDMAGVPVVEVAALEQVPPGTVAARLSRARRVLGDALAEYAPSVPASYGPYARGGQW